MEAPHLKAVAAVVRILGFHVRAIEYQTPGLRTATPSRARPDSTLVAGAPQCTVGVVAVARGAGFSNHSLEPFRVLPVGTAPGDN